MANHAASSSPSLQIIGDDELLFDGSESGWVEARTHCDHLASLSSDLVHIPTPGTPCNRFVFLNPRPLVCQCDRLCGFNCNILEWLLLNINGCQNGIPRRCWIDWFELLSSLYGQWTIRHSYKCINCLCQFLPCLLKKHISITVLWTESL